MQLVTESQKHCLLRVPNILGRAFKQDANALCPCSHVGQQKLVNNTPIYNEFYKILSSMLIPILQGKYPLKVLAVY